MAKAVDVIRKLWTRQWVNHSGGSTQFRTRSIDFYARNVLPRLRGQAMPRAA